MSSSNNEQSYSCSFINAEEQKYPIYDEKEVEEFLKIVNNVKDKEEKQKFITVSENLPKLYIQDLNEANQEDNHFMNESDRSFSISSMKNALLSIIESNSIVVIQGPTGCGKSTQIPKLILNTHITKRLYCNIIVTQPRRIAAISIAKRVSQKFGCQVGTLVGYRVSMQQEHSFQTRLTYCTTEYLLQYLIYKKHMCDYTHIILDEVHERNHELDFLMLVIKKLLQTNSKLVKVILMSATINAKKFANYFSTPVKNKLVPAPIVEISNKQHFKIYTYYLDDMQDIDEKPEITLGEPKMTKSMLDFCTKIIIALDQIDITDNLKNEEEKDKNTVWSQRHAVLIFLPGIYEIDELYTLLSSECYKDKLWDLVMLHSLISNEEQQRVFYKPPLHHRRIILSTNIAESSITVPDVKYVIDFCLTKMIVVDPVANYESLQLCWASKANCVQRAGRTGRTMDGRVYRLVSKAFYNNILGEVNKPEILHAPLANVVLRAKIFDISDPRSLLSLALDPPNLQNLASTILSLKECGALVNNEIHQPFDGKLTNLGRIMAYLPLNIQITKLIMLGHVFGILRDAIILGASMALNDIFMNHYCHSTVSSYTVKKTWSHEFDSDCIAALNIYKAWQNEKANRRLASSEAERQWARRQGVQLRSLRELNVLVNEITHRLKNLGVQETVGTDKVIWENREREFVLQVILAGAFYPNYFVKHPQDAEIQKDNIMRHLDTRNPMTTVYLRGWPLNQPGYLYAKKLQKIFSKRHGIPEKQIVISFDNTQRIYVEFYASETMMSDENLYRISDFVYKAVKMRYCADPIIIELLSLKEAQKRSKAQNLDRFKKSIFFSKEMISHVKSRLPKIRPELPSVDKTFIPLSIQNIVSPGYFWAIMDDEETRKKILKIESALNAHPLQEFCTRPEIATMVAAPMEKDSLITYQRAIIEGYMLQLANVFFIDYGCASRVQVNDLRVIGDVEIMELPSLAFRCVLAAIRPANDMRGRWSRVARDCFKTQIYGNKKIFGKIYSVADSTVNLELIVVNSNEEEINVNEYLIENRYAMKREESCLSKNNHDLRMNISTIETLSPEKISFYNEQQYSTDYLPEYPDPPEKKDCVSEIKLLGPYSPLEINMVQLTAIGKHKSVSIDSNSVNSVLLDENTDKSMGLLVAQSVFQRTNTDSLILRNTTLLPSIPGLMALLALIFTPRIELRRSFLGSYYTGALCGLGPIDNYSGKGVFPDHDMEIPFDVEISINDLQEINKLRHWMNVGIQLSNNGAYKLDNQHDDDDNNNDDDDDNSIIDCQSRVKRVLLELRNRHRRSQDPVKIDNFHRWNLYDESLFLLPARDIEKDSIYPLHKALELKEKNDELEEMVRHLAMLNQLTNQDMRKMGNTKILCKLCDVEVIGLLSLRGHLYSEQHIKREDNLQIPNLREYYYCYY